MILFVDIVSCSVLVLCCCTSSSALLLMIISLIIWLRIWWKCEISKPFAITRCQHKTEAFVIRSPAAILLRRPIGWGLILTLWLSHHTLSVGLLVSPEAITCRADLSFTADVLFFTYFIFIFFKAKSPRCVGRPAWNFARWSVVGPIL